MYSKFIICAFITALSLLTAVAQTPDSKMERDAPLNRAFAFSFEGNGSYLGVQTSEITKDNFSKYGLSDVRGVAVAKVVEGSPAAAAGLKDGDVIVRFNGDAVTSGRKLSRLVSEVSPDHQARLTVLRGGAAACKAALRGGQHIQRDLHRGVERGVVARRFGTGLGLGAQPRQAAPQAALREAAAARQAAVAERRPSSSAAS